MACVRRDSFSGLAAALAAAAGPSKTSLIAIDGCSGAGKSRFVGHLVAALRARAYASELLRLDDCFYRPTARAPIYFREPDSSALANDYDFDWQRLRAHVLGPLRAERPAIFQRYDVRKKEFTDWIRIAPGGVVIVDGVSSLRRELVAYYDYRIFVHAPKSERLERVCKRDGERYRPWYKYYWMPEEQHYVQHHRPELAADIVVDGSGKAADDYTAEFTVMMERGSE